jgi:hypothetical protein
MKATKGKSTPSPADREKPSAAERGLSVRLGGSAFWSFILNGEKFSFSPCKKWRSPAVKGFKRGDCKYRPSRVEARYEIRAVSVTGGGF